MKTPGLTPKNSDRWNIKGSDRSIQGGDCHKYRKGTQNTEQFRNHSGKWSNNTPPYLVAKIANWKFSERIKSAFIAENQNGNSWVFASQMHSKSLTLRQNQALKHWYELKEGDLSIQGYVVRYPATLMIKRAGERKYRVEKKY